MNKSSDRDKILTVLKKNADNKKVKLPSNIDFSYDLETKTLLVIMKGIEPSKNMQTDGAAIEGWILVLYHYLKAEDLEISVEKIELKWEKQNKENWDTSKVASKGHYYRFLYRIARFQAIFNDWFSISTVESELYGEDKVFIQKDKYSDNLALNVIEKSRQIPKLNDKHAREVIAEYNLAKVEGFKKEFLKKFDIDEVERQIPTGLFSNGEAKEVNRIFTGGASAIDLIGINTEKYIAKIFELKLDNNTKVGVISELFFYTCVIEDLIKENFVLTKNKKISLESSGFYDKLKKCKEIEAHILIQASTHVLLNEKVLKPLNDALLKQDFKISFKISEYSQIEDASRTETPSV